MGTLLDRVYARAPVPLQHAMVSAFGARWHWKRFGPGYGAELRGYLERGANDAAAWQAYQTQMLRKLLHLAWSRIPYYRRAWAGLGLDADVISRFTLADLPQLPILEKDAVRSEPEAFCIDGVAPPGSTICPTSGSSGTPVRVYFTNADFRRGMAIREARSCMPAGVSFRQPRATFSGRLVVPHAESRGPFHRFNAVERQVYFSAFHLAPQNAAAYLEPLRKHQIVWATGYTHAWEQLAGFVIEQGLPPVTSLRAIITTSEKLTPSGRARIERAFGCRVYQEYGTVEDALFACERKDGRLYLSPDAGILELRRDDGQIIPMGSSEPGETITTAFGRQSQLFIRYRLGDVAAWDANQRGEVEMPILADVIGRLEDVVEAPDGRRTVRFHGVFTEVAGVREAQVIQLARNRLRILVVGSHEFGDRTINEITTRVHARLTKAMIVEVERVDAIPRTAAGKFKAVVNAMS